jgi:HK97 family phage prohead protease
MHRAYSVLEIRATGEANGKRTFSGIATTPATDSYDDIVEPKGAEFALPLPLLWQHNASDPIGWVTSAKVTAKGIEIQGEVASVTEEGPLKQRLSMAWDYLRNKLVRGLSIGFKPIESARIEGSYGYRYTKWKWLELSAVTIGANHEATITAIKSADAALRALSGPEQRAPVKTKALLGTKAKGNEVKTLIEMTEARETKSARMSELVEVRKTAEGGKFTAEQAAEFDTLESELTELEEEMRIARFNERMAAGATRVRSDDAGVQRRGPHVFARKEDPEDKFKGQSFTRLVIAKALARIRGESAATIAQERWGQTHPKFVQFVRAAVAGGGTGSGEWGAELAAQDGRFTGDFIEFLYGLTVFDRIPMRAVPARVTVKGQDGAATGNWVGESKAIPMSKPDFSTVDLLPLKVAALTVLSNELIQDSQPEAEGLVRDSLAQASAQRVDTTFLSATAASAGVSPAGLLNGVSAIAASAATADGFRADMQSLLSIFVTAKQASGITLVMNPGTALALSMLVNSLGQEEFPGITMNGGNFKGMNIVVGDNVTSGNIIAIRAQDVWKIGDSGIQVSMSDVATIEQDDAPAGASDTPVAMASSFVSMFQSESTAFKVVRRINFQKRRTGAVQYISDAEYGGVVS